MTANLVIQTAFVGDLFLSLPLLRGLKALEPERPLAVLTRRGLGEVLLAYGVADQVIEVDKSSGRSWRQVRAALKAEQFHHILSPHSSVRSALLAFGLRAQGQKLGYRFWWNRWAFDLRSSRPHHWPDALRQLSLLRPLSELWGERLSNLEGERGDLNNPDDFQRPQQQVPLFDCSEIPIPEWAQIKLGELSDQGPWQEEVQVWMEQQGISSQKKGERIFMAPGSVWPTKRWTLEGFAQVARALATEGYEVILVGTAQERELCAQITDLAGSPLSNWAGQTTLVQLLESFRQGALLIGNDSGSQHMAASVGLPLVSIFGPTTLSLGYRPWQERALVVGQPLPCRPCGPHGAKKCPLGTHECMKSISAERVLSAARQLLN